MKRGAARCIMQTISMSDSKTCARPKRVQKLVSAELADPCPNFGQGSTSYWTPRPVPIKICTRKDMLRACPPKVSACPPKPVKRTKTQILIIKLVLLLKCTIVAILLYWLYTDGNLPFFPDIDKIDMSRFRKAKYSFIQKYNNAVLKIMDVLVQAPQTVRQKFTSILGTQKKTVENEEDSEEMFLEDVRGDD